MLLVYKNLCETPLECLERIRIEKSITPDVPMTYAGRLDPMAEGFMILLVGDECKEKAQYTGLPKTYEFEILEGFATDTYDLLGLVTDVDMTKKLDIEQTAEYLAQTSGPFMQQYPPYSSKTFEGKQLHAHAREGVTPQMEHEVSLNDFEFLSERTIAVQECVRIIRERVGGVHGDFRQEEIVQKWEEVLGGAATESPLRITRWRISVSSGFYVRQLVHDIGAMFHIPLVTFHIQRTRIGKEYF